MFPETVKISIRFEKFRKAGICSTRYVAQNSIFFFRGICPAQCVLRQCTVVFAFKCRLILFVRAWAMPRVLYLSCGIPFPV